jgi:hypothetical protein
MVGRRRVSNLSVRAGHMASDARVVGLLGAALVLRQLAIRLAMAVEAAAAIVLRLRSFLGQSMRVVARNAAELSHASRVAAALVHLLDMADEAIDWLAGSRVAGRRGRVGRRRREENSFDGRPGQARPKILALAAARFDAHQAAEVALLTDGLAQPRLQVRRIDDGKVGSGGDGFVGAAAFTRGDVQLARAVAALAADRVAGEGWRFVLVGRPLDVQCAIGMTEQAL